MVNVHCSAIQYFDRLSFTGFLGLNGRRSISYLVSAHFMLQYLSDRKLRLSVQVRMMLICPAGIGVWQTAQVFGLRVLTCFKANRVCLHVFCIGKCCLSLVYACFCYFKVDFCDFKFEFF
jgi:hypothetical protein